MNRIARDDLRAPARRAVVAAAFARLGDADVRVSPGGKSDRLDAGLPLEGGPAGTTAASGPPTSTLRENT